MEEEEEGESTALFHLFGAIAGDETQSPVDDEGQYTAEEHGAVQTFLHRTVLFADDEIEAVQVIDDILDGPGEDSHHDDGEDERCHRCRHFEAIVESDRFLLGSGDPVNSAG